MPDRFYRQLENIHVNTLPPSAYFIPFEAPGKAVGERENSAYFHPLSGEWDFAFFENVEELAVEDADFPSTVVCPDKIAVPMCWQLYRGRGYDSPNYINQDYSFPVDPPYLPDVIPCGFYRRSAFLSPDRAKNYQIHFEGVSSCFYLWVNGEFIGYSQVSHSTSAFDITQFLKDGDNLFEVLVVKHCTGSYMEDQDFFRLSGIFRDVYILERNAGAFTDLTVDCGLSEDLSRAVLTVRTDSRLPLSWELFSPGGETVQRGTGGKDFSIPVEAPELWNAEEPALYTLLLHCGDEYTALPVGFRRVEIKDRCLLFNNRKIKLRGINRHDSNPETGYTVTEKDMLRDLTLLKQANVNTIRTSHYPNDPRFLAMCDRMGFLLIDEADLESHGMGYNYGDWYWDYWAYLCDAPEWEEACLDRAERLYERDKNHPCVIMWSLGNESGCGENHRKMANLIRSKDPKAIIHYENARLEYEGRVGKDFKDISDVESRMYASLDYLKEYLSDPKMTKPFFYCEYVAAWSTGDIPLHWDGFEDCDNYCGGCVWEFTDHAVNIGTKEAPAYRYGGDFGDYPNDGVYCVDGVVYPDRTPKPGFYDMKECYKPFGIQYEKGTVTVFNKNYFTPFTDHEINWTLEKDGRVIKEGCIGGFSVPARSRQSFVLFREPELSGFMTLNLSAVRTAAAGWAKKGYETGHCQFILSDAPVRTELRNASPLKIKESRTSYVIYNGDTEYCFNRITGMIDSVKRGKELLASPIGLSVFRSYHPSNGMQSQWKRARYDHAFMKHYSSEITECTEEKIVLCSKLSFAAAAMPPAFHAELLYTFTADGKLNISAQAVMTDNAPPLPRFGLSFAMPKGFENISYLGFGPKESYCDRYASQMLRRYETTVKEDFEHYIKPAECSAHYRTKSALVTDDEGCGFLFEDTSAQGFSFTAKHYTDRQLLETAHDDELIPSEKTFISLDYKIFADNPGFSETAPERKFDEKTFGFSFDIIPWKRVEP